MSVTRHVDRHWSRWRLRADRRGEDGAIVVIFAAALVMIMVFVGFAVDLGNFTQRHQQTQDAADAAALSGAQQLGQGSSTSVVAASVENYVDLNDGYAPAPGSNVWDTCPASTIPTGFTAPATPDGSTQDCVTFGQIGNGRPVGSTPVIAASVIHVVIPPEIVDYIFGRAAGLSSVHISSAATAAVESPGSTTILPVALGTVAENGGYWCIKGGHGGATCPNSIAPGDEGLLISPRYRTFTGTSNSGTGTNATGEVDLAIGLDHELNVYPGPVSTVYCDADSSPASTKCGSATENDTASTYDLASEVFLESGNTANTAVNGLVAGFTADSAQGGFTFSPRLAHPDGYLPTGTNSATSDPPGSPATPTLGPGDAGYEGTTLNGRHISYYMLNEGNGWGSTGPTSLATSTYTGCFGSNTSAPSTDNVNNPFWTTGNQCLAKCLAAWTTLANTGKYSNQTVPNCLPSPAPSTVTGGPIFSSSIIDSPRFGFVPVVANGGGGESAMWQIVGFAAVYLDVIDVQGKDLSADAWVFSPQLIQSNPAPPGAGLGMYLDGPYVTNLCSLAAGNC